jgi:4'-phosphopantetheinyl transferase
MNCGVKSGEVRVWWMKLDAPPAGVVARWRSCLDASEQAQAVRFHFREDRETYIAAHWLIRTALASVGGLPPADWRFVAEKLGKPRIDPSIGPPELKFNLAHSRGFVACAITLGNEIGIDVESLDRGQSGLDVAAHFFSPVEVAILRGTTPERQHEAFLRFWTLKEAFIKATGEGLSRPLDSFSFALDPVSISFRQDQTDDPTGWQFIECRPTAQHLLALAIERPQVTPVTLTERQVPSSD